MNRPVRTTTPSGEAIVIVPADQYERLVAAAEDARDVAIAEKALAEFEAGVGEALTDAEMSALLRAHSPLAFWRKRRSLTQPALAKAVGITQGYLAQIERGTRVGDVDLHRRLADVLRLDIEDLLPAPKEQSGVGKAKRALQNR